MNRGLASAVLLSIAVLAWGQTPPACSLFEKNESFIANKPTKWAVLETPSGIEIEDFEVAQNSVLSDTNGTTFIRYYFTKNDVTASSRFQSGQSWDLRNTDPGMVVSVTQASGLWTAEGRIYRIKKFNPCTGTLTPEAVPVLVESGDLGNMSPSFHTDGTWISGLAMFNYRKSLENAATPSEWRGEFELRIVHNGPITGTDFQNGVEFPVYQFEYGIALDSVNGSSGSPSDGSSDSGSSVFDIGKLAASIGKMLLDLIVPTPEQFQQIRNDWEGTDAFAMVQSMVNFPAELWAYIQNNSGDPLNSQYSIGWTMPLGVDGDGVTQTQAVTSSVELGIVPELVKFARTLALAGLMFFFIFRVRTLIAYCFNLRNLMGSAFATSKGSS